MFELDPRVTLVKILDVTPLEFDQDLRQQKATVPVLLCGAVCFV